jgi:pimeloyl-ACP methyl ester carboxylesterase
LRCRPADLQDRRVEAITRPDGMHLEVTGSGPPVVLTHGFGDDTSTFDGQLVALGGYRVCRWDLPGHGRSDPEGEPSTRASALAWLDAAIEAAGPGPAVLVGHSLGGYLSLCRTVLDPAGVAGLVLIATGPGFRDATKREAWNDFVAGFGERQGVPASARGICGQPDSVVLDRLQDVHVPVLVLVGGDDQRYHAGSQVIADRASDARLVHVDGAGHFPHRTHAEEFNAHLGAFLDRVLPA